MMSEKRKKDVKTCPECGEDLRFAMIDVDGTNLEEGYECTNTECNYECLAVNMP